jgi:hypothetical protein
VNDVHRRALVAHLWGQQAERRLAFYLREMDERRLYRDLRSAGKARSRRRTGRSR